MRDAGADPRARTEAINDILHTISIIPDVVEQSLYLDEFARRVGVESNVLAAQLKKFVAKRAEDAYNKRRLDEARSSIDGVASEPFPPVEPPADMADKYNTPAPAATVAAPAEAPKAIPVREMSRSLYMAEEELIKYVLRRGLMYLCDVYPTAEATEAVPMSIVDYIDCELRNEGIGFADPTFRRIWEEALRLRDTEWPEAWRRQSEHLAEARALALAQGQEDIRNRDADSETILQLEQALTERVDKEYNKAVDDFSSAFIRRCLLRSDDRGLIDLVARLSSDPVVLSRMYPREDPREEARIKLPLAVNTLKSALLKEELMRLAAELADPNLSKERSLELMERFREIKVTSMDFDKYNGEIVITPSRP